MITSNNFQRELHCSPLVTKSVIASHLQSFLMLSRPILFRQPPKYEEDGSLHPTLDCVNVFLFQMVTSDAQPFSTFFFSEKIEDMLFEVKKLPLRYKGALNGQRSLKFQNNCAKVSLQLSGRLELIT
jgi:hypothetical protein